MKKYLTKENLEKLKKDLQYLKEVKRKEMAERLEKSLSFGDLSENFEYQEAKEAQAFLEGQIAELEELINSAVIVEKGDRASGFVQIGSTILTSSGGLKKDRFIIVGAKEANPLEGKISVDSPLGKAFLDKPEGAVIETVTPIGKAKYKIVKIE
ncbi:MAG: transcription elongation factor GreA [Candidatus Nealsonbacteria bacterium]|nr:transcription elongation factor GreA [Candidatus Nealsonbacteria bacterium]